MGELKLGGLTKKQAEQMVVEKLKPYMKETPIVTVRMVNYKISVIGEVTRPVLLLFLMKKSIYWRRLLWQGI